MIILSISTLDTILVACLLDIPMTVSFALYHPLQLCCSHNDLTTVLLEDMECSGEDYYAGLAPPHQTAVNVA